MSARSSAAAAATTAAALHVLPTLGAIRPLRLRLAPALSGVGRATHVALTFDDGPDEWSTPYILDALEELGVRASFFVLGAQLLRAPHLAARASAEGHEVAVHGFTHRTHLLRTPAAIHDDMTRAASAVHAATGVRPRYWRPPHGIPTGVGLWSARQQHLRPVLWTADGRDWRTDATAESVGQRIVAQLTPGAVVLLHDADGQAAPGTGRRAADALPRLVDACRDRGWQIGPLRDHGLENSHAQG